MSEASALFLARNFHSMDSNYGNESQVQNLINEGYSPDDALKLAGYAGYDD